MKKECSYIRYFFISVLVLVGGFLRIWNLDRLPRGINLQEVGMGYDAYCMAAFGVDRYTYAHPFYFMGYGKGQGTLYTYLIAEIFKYVSPSVWALRLPMAALSVITLFLGMKIMKKINMPSFYCYLFGGLFAILPVFVTTARIADPSNLIAFFSVISVLFLVYALKDKKSLYWFLAGLSLGLSLYTTGMAYIYVPLFVLVFLIVAIWCKEINLRNGTAFLLPYIFLAIPCFIQWRINFQELDTIVAWKFTFPNLFGWSKEEMLPFDLQGIDAAFIRIFAHDQFDIYSNHKIGMFTWLGIPFAIIGFISLWSIFKRTIRTRTFDEKLLFFFWILAVLVSTGFIQKEQEDAWHVYGIYPAMLFCILFGMHALINRVGERWKLVCKLAVTGAFLLPSLFFVHSYFGNSTEYFMFQPIFFEAMDKIRDNPELQGRMVYIIDHKEPQLYYDLSAKQNPYEPISNVTYGYSGIPDENGIYIIDEKYCGIVDQLQEAGFHEASQYDGYVLIY